MSMLWETVDRSLKESLCYIAISTGAIIIAVSMITIWVCLAVCAVILTGNVIAGTL